jgi:hypothetical protein
MPRPYYSSAVPNRTSTASPESSATTIPNHYQSILPMTPTPTSSPPQAGLEQVQDPWENQSTEDLIASCCVCFLPMSSVKKHCRSNVSGRGDEAPRFWLTSCGHILCSSHLFQDSGINSRLSIIRKLKISRKCMLMTFCRANLRSISANNGGHAYLFILWQ